MILSAPTRSVNLDAGLVSAWKSFATTKASDPRFIDVRKKFVDLGRGMLQTDADRLSDHMLFFFQRSSLGQRPSEEVAPVIGLAGLGLIKMLDSMATDGSPEREVRILSGTKMLIDQILPKLDRYPQLTNDLLDAIWQYDERTENPTLTKPLRKIISKALRKFTLNGFGIGGRR